MEIFATCVVRHGILGNDIIGRFLKIDAIIVVPYGISRNCIIG
jgi:hypothetical protein